MNDLRNTHVGTVAKLQVIGELGPPKAIMEDRAVDLEIVTGSATVERKGQVTPGVDCIGGARREAIVAPRHVLKVGVVRTHDNRVCLVRRRYGLQFSQGAEGS